MSVQRKRNKHEISTQEDVDFLVSWIKTACKLDLELRGKVNAVSINFTDKFVGLCPRGVLSIENAGAEHE